jgi:hypothetical protein
MGPAGFFPGLAQTGSLAVFVIKMSFSTILCHPLVAK